MKQWSVYIHINKINQKVYIGQTSNIKQRWQNSGANYKDSPYFYQAIQKYGWENFEHTILKNNLTKEEANYWERYYITAFYKSNIRENGYNLNSGGDGALHNQETLNKMSKKQKERYVNISQEEREKIRQHCIKINKMYLESATSEEILKNSQAGRDAANKYWENHPIERKEHLDTIRKIAIQKNSKKVYCLETGITYESSQAAAAAIGKKDGSPIRRSCKSKGKNKGSGYHWIWEKDKEDIINERKSEDKNEI